MEFTERMKNKAISRSETLVLPEGTEPRILKAGRIILDQKLAGKIILVGSEKLIKGIAEEENTDLSGFIITDPEIDPRKKEFTEEYFNLRKHKGITEEEAAYRVSKPVFWGAMLVKKGEADAMVAGAVTSTADVLHAALQIIKTKPGSKYASSFFIMCHPDRRWGHNGQMIFADCGTIPDPSPEQLCEIALDAAQSCRAYLETDPVVALLSFSTKGSAFNASTNKVVKALELIKKKDPGLIVDGELQADAALVPEVAAFKAPGSPVGGKANVFIFPDLNSGNICYKMVQRLGGCGAYGPLLQGFSLPVSDLSRGCTVEDIVNISVLTMVRKE